LVYGLEPDRAQVPQISEVHVLQYPASFVSCGGLLVSED